MPGTVTGSAFARIGQLAAQRRVHAAFQWMHLNEQRIMAWHSELAAIAAPPFGEGARAAWLADKFRELRLEDVSIDAAGNAIAACKGVAKRAGGACVLLSAHIDTVFPAETALAPSLHQHRLTAPGACDNGAGVA